MLSLAFLVVGGTVLGFGAYTWLLRVTSAAAVSTYAFVNPVVALLLAWAVGDGELSARTGVAAALVVGGGGVQPGAGTPCKARGVGGHYAGAGGPGTTEE